MSHCRIDDIAAVTTGLRPEQILVDSFVRRMNGSCTTIADMTSNFGFQLCPVNATRICARAFTRHALPYRHDRPVLNR